MTTLCFTACYAIALALEISRLALRSGTRLAFIAGWTALGLVAQALYLTGQARETAERGAPLSSWYHWCLVAAWLLVAAYLYLLLRKPAVAVGVFMLPLALALIAVAYFGRDMLLDPFPTAQAHSFWAKTHGGFLLMGTVTVCFGFVAGLMYIAQSYRLKHKLLPRQGFRLPSLEWLQGASEQSVVVSSLLVGVGVAAGIVMNLFRLRESAAVPWSDPVVWTSLVLFLWLLAAAVFNLLHRPARRGRKVAYLTVANFIFLCLVLAIALFAPSRHTPRRAAVAIETPAVVVDRSSPPVSGEGR